ncbi:MAG: SGNH/GDSL hydrolase family protein [Saprospiraceae bacterium]|nr:SGNH/GDSL hydrolase family protein [Saprospiraceae bacterium]
MPRQLAFKIISILLGTLLALLLVEVGYRVIHFVNYVDFKKVVAKQQPPVVKPGEELDLGEFIQLSPHRRIIYELVPSSKFMFKGKPVEVSAQGFRDKEYPTEKPKQAKRLIGLGDSVMFGWGVDEPDCYLTQLENSLNEEQDSILYEVINTGVPGYNTAMEVATLEQKFKLDEVDLVIINYIGNDCDLPNFIHKKPKYLTLKKSFILMRFFQNDELNAPLEGAPMNHLGSGYVNKQDLVPSEYSDMVDVPGYLKAMQRLKELQTAHGFQVIVLATNPDAPTMDYVQLACDSFGLDLLDVYPIWKEYKKANPTAVWEQSAEDTHPSPAAHKLIATALRQRVYELFTSEN